MASDRVDTLIENAVEENSDYLEMLIGSFMAANDAELDEVELVVDTCDPHRIVMYPRLRTEDTEASPPYPRPVTDWPY